MGLKDEVIDQMQIHRSRRNDSMSDVAVDLFAYIHREIPFTQCNLNKSLRKEGDCKSFHFLPGRKFQLIEEDIVNLQDITRSDMIWLKDTFNISYSFDHKSPKNIQLEFDDNYVDKMIIALQKKKPIMKKLIYDYIKLKITEVNLDVKSQNNLLILESHIKDNNYLITKLSYSQLCKAIRIKRFLYRPVKRWLLTNANKLRHSRRLI